MRALLAIALVFAAGCTVSFDPEGQPCDAAGKCLAGYTCDLSKTCHSTTSGGSTSAGSTHGGTSGGSTTTTVGTVGSASSSTGTSATTATTTSGTSTSGSSGTSGAASCTGVICPAAQTCQVVGSVASCVARAANTICNATQACAAGQTCLQPPNASEGICAESCDAGCGTGEACAPMVGARGNTFNLCVGTPSPRLCTGTNQCGTSGLTCLPFDSLNATGALATELPILFCNTAAGSGLSGSACSNSASCISGVCAIDPSNGSTCVDTCSSDADCGGGEHCMAVTDNTTTGRNVRGCTRLPDTGCTDCSACGPDASGCDTTFNVCGLPCDPSTEIDPCGHGRACVLDALGNGSFCYVDAGNPLICPF